MIYSCIVQKWEKSSRKFEKKVPSKLLDGNEDNLCAMMLETMKFLNF